jgi:hypothetical protein
MKKFKDKNLTDTEWEEVFDYPKEFNTGDIVEWYGSVWKIVELMPYKKGIDFVYKVKNLVTRELACFSSTFLQPIGTFVDDEPFTKEKI